VPQLARRAFTYAAYVRLEAASPVKHEFLDGVVYAMAGGSPEHAAIAARVIRLLDAGVAGRPCRVFTSDLRIRVQATGLATYPDASVVCEALETDPEDPLGHSVVNPIVLVEVMSPTTEDYDRGEKLAHYKRIPSLRELVLLSFDEPHIEVWRWERTRWSQRSYRSGEAAPLESVDCTLPVDVVYEDPLA